MENIKVIEVERVYANNGQHYEMCARFTLTGELCKADNKPHTAGGDVLDIQLKSARATVCKGTDLQAYLDLDGANRYGYITKDFVLYLMNRAEYTEFVQMFGTVTRESEKNGGAEKIRLGHETKKMLDWLAERV